MMEKAPDCLVAGTVGEQFEAGFTPLMQQAQRDYGLPGLAVGIVAQGQVAYARGFGVLCSGQPAPVNLRTVFHLASVSKPFSATAILQLAGQGKVQLDAPVVEYLPYFMLADERYREITVQHMLSHVSGMPDVEDYEWNNPQYDAGALERYVRGLAGEKLIAAPGEKFACSNMAFECLGALISQVSGLSFDDYVKQHILDPAGMAESTFLKPDYLPENWAAPHVRLLADAPWAGYPYNRRHAPSSTLHSNIIEMCHWAITNLNRGSFAGRQVLPADAYELLWTPRARLSANEQVGLSWFLREYHGERTVEHGGGDVGFSSQFSLLPERAAAVVVLCNSIPAPVEAIADAALDLLLSHPPAPLLPYASQGVRKTLLAAGVEAAVAQWQALKAEHPTEYNFGLGQFAGLYLANCAGRMAEAAQLARLCTCIFSPAEQEEFADILQIFADYPTD